MADGAVVIDIKGDDSKFVKTLKNLGSVAKSALGTALGQIGASALTGLASAAKQALGSLASDVMSVGKSFESSMSNVGALMGIDKTSEDFAKLKQAASEAGATTVFSASEAADALGYMALAGWNAGEATSALGGVLNLAAASGMDLAAASDMVTDYLSAFSMEAEQAGYFADVMAYAQANSNTSVEQLGQAFKNCAANMNAAGQDVETTTSLLAMMANQGMKGSEAGTKLTAIMRDLTAQMEDGCVTIGDTSVAVMDANGNYRDLTDILRDVEGATYGMGDAERAAALKSVFTADSIGGLNLILNAGVDSAMYFEAELRGAGTTMEGFGDRIDEVTGGSGKLSKALEKAGISSDVMADAVKYSCGEFEELHSHLMDQGVTAEQYEAMLKELGMTSEELADAFYTASGSAELMAKKMNDNLAGDLKMARSAYEGFCTAIYEGANGPLRSLVQIVSNDVMPALTGIVTGVEGSEKRLQDALGKLAGEAVKTITEIAPTAIGAVSSILSAVVQALAEAAPTILTALVSLAGELIAALIEALPAFVTAIVSGISALVDTVLTQLLPLLAQQLPAIMTALMEGLTSLVGQLSEMLPTLIEETLPTILAAIVSTAEAFVEALPSFIQALADLITALVAEIPNYIDTVIAAALALFNAIVEALPQIIPALIDAAIQVVFAVVDLLPTLIPALIQGALALFKAIVEALPQIMPALIDAGIQVIFAVIDMLPTLIPTLVSAAVELFMALVQAVPMILGSLLEAVGSLLGRLPEAIGGFASHIFDAAGQMMHGLLDGIAGAAGAVWNKITEVCSGALGAIKSFFGIASPSKVMRLMGVYLDEGFGEGIEDSESDVVRAMRGVMDATMDAAELGVKDHGYADAAFASAAYGNASAAATAASAAASRADPRFDALADAIRNMPPAVVIEEMGVREEADIHRISEELAILTRRRGDSIK